MPATVLNRLQPEGIPPDADGEGAKTHVNRTPRTLRFYGDEFVFDTVSGMFFVVSSTASFILRAVDAGTPSDQLADKLQRRYGITRATAVRDIERLFDSMATIEPLRLVRV